MKNSFTVKESDIAFDMVEPCADCPFRLSTPCDKKGITQEQIQLIAGFHLDQLGRNEMHSCHVTDPRVTDGGYKGHKGKLQHCAGFMLMLVKSERESGPMIRAAEAGRLDLAKLKSVDLVHSIKDYLKAAYDWAHGELYEY